MPLIKFKAGNDMQKKKKQNAIFPCSIQTNIASKFTNEAHFLSAITFAITDNQLEEDAIPIRIDGIVLSLDWKIYC